ncbi:MAG: hypothetical protein WCF04_14065 [Candidatus Nanopelagicales bacterium]
MSSIVNPVGPEEPSTYWRRRAMVGVALLVFLLLLWWIIRALFGSDSEAPTDGTTPSPDSSAAASSTPTPAASPSESAVAATTSSAGAGREAVARCADADIDVVLKATSRSTATGAGMRVTLTVVNTGEDPCRRDVGAGANELLVTSGSQVIWSSDACQPGKGSDSVTLKPSKPWSTSASWPGKVTGRVCPADQPVAKAGTYRVQGRNGSVQSAVVRFSVT